MKLAKWTIAAITSYVGTMWIKTFGIIFTSTILWFVCLYFLDKFLEGEI